MNYLDIYKKVISYHRQYTNMNSSDAEWEQCVSDGDFIVRSFNNGQFTRDLVMAVQNEISRKLGGNKNE